MVTMDAMASVMGVFHRSLFNPIRVPLPRNLRRRSLRDGVHDSEINTTE
jgi:hypothetical protein